MKIKKNFAFCTVFAAVTALLATTAFASVTFDQNTGTGFVGKGEVQSVFRWNNYAAQQQANNVLFSYNSSSSYDVTIEFETGNPANPLGTTHYVVNQNKATSVIGSVDARKNGQYSGWNLTGLGTPTVSGDPLPSIGDGCPNGTLATCHVTAVTLISSTGGLFVTWHDNTVQLQ